MKYRNSHVFLLARAQVFACAIVTICLRDVSAVGSFFVTDVGALPAGNGTSVAYDINSAGQIVGISRIGSGYHAFLWQPANANDVVGTIVDLGDLPGGKDDSHASGINDLGQVVGRSNTSTGDRAFLWQPTVHNAIEGTFVDLGDLHGGVDSSDAQAINNYGQVVGYSQASSGLHGFLWQPTMPNGVLGSLNDLGYLPTGGQTSTGHDINAGGYVVGVSGTSADRRPFLWSPNVPNAIGGAMVDLGDLHGGLSEGGAIAINDDGWIVGHSSPAATDFHAFVRPPNGNLIDLGDLPGGSDYSLGRDINKFGHVVGTAGGDGGLCAFLWTQSDGMLNLNEHLDVASSVGWTLQYATAINNVGQIIGYGTFNGSTRAFLLTPYGAPEPASICLAAAGVIVMGCLVRRRRIL